ncbi:MAG: hypothetical protein ACYS4W_10040, partial [Planctomycetota bacterium]
MPDKLMVTTSHEVGFSGRISTVSSHDGSSAWLWAQRSKTKTVLIKIAFFIFVALHYLPIQ